MANKLGHDTKSTISGKEHVLLKFAPLRVFIPTEAKLNTALKEQARAPGSGGC